MTKKLKVIIFLAVTAAINLMGQSDLRFNHLTNSEGLSQNAVTCIFQDSHGFMWFGTQDGLNRYDGYKFKVFRNVEGDSASLSDNFIFSILETEHHKLIVETQSGMFNLYNPLTESFEVVDKKSFDLPNSRMSSVKAYYYDKKNNVEWTGGLSREIGLTGRNLSTGVEKNYRNDPKDNTSLSNDKVYSIFRDSEDVLWVGTFDGLNKFNEENETFTHYRNDPGNKYSLSDNWIWPIQEDSKGTLWIGTVRGGLNRFDRNTGRFVSYQNDPTLVSSLSDDFIFSIYEDKGGMIWVGTNTGGVNFFHSSLQVIEHFISKPNDSESLSDNSVLSILVDQNGIYWIGTGQGGLNRLDHSTKSFSKVSIDLSKKNNPLNDSILEIFQDSEGLLWLGTFSSGLISYDPVGGKFKHYTKNSSGSSSLSDNRIYAISEEPAGVIWIGTYGGGLDRLDKSTGNVEFFLHNENDTSSISSNSVWSIEKDAEGKLWLGTFGGGINIFDPVRGSFTKFINDPNDSGSIGDNNIVTIFNDSKGIMWIGTTKGIYKNLPGSNLFKGYRQQDGLANDLIFGIVEDNDGFLWISTNNGLSKFDPRTETFSNYYYNDGLQSNEFNQNSFAKDEFTGRLLFGGPNGLNIFNPEDLKPNEFVPPVVFTNYLRFNTDDEEGKPIREKGISERDSIILTYKDNIVTFEFSALSYYNNFENKYKYKLEGFNDNWIQLGNNHTVTFTNLSPDDYRLIVLGSNNDGIWNNAGNSLFIEVKPPWWKTNIAYGFYFILFFTGLYGLRKFELNRREQKAKIRESELRIKASEAEKRVLEIENERKTKELEEARELQLSMLPKELPELPNLEIAAFMRTATEVGGDYYDFMVLENGELNIAFGDATGHGLQAGTMVTLMKGFFTSDSSNLGLREFMTHCSLMIKEIKLGRILMSFSYLKIEEYKLSISSGGMPPMLFYSRESGNVDEILVPGMPLGASRNPKYQLVEKDLSPGDTILLMTDGLAEQMNTSEEMIDYPRVKEQFSQVATLAPNEIIDKMVSFGDEWMNGRVQDDDITLVVLKIK